jgi:hypothetical protein
MVDIRLVNATRLHLFNGKPAFEPGSRHNPGHRLYPHENNAKTAEALFPVRYTVIGGLFTAPSIYRYNPSPQKDNYLRPRPVSDQPFAAPRFFDN